MLSVVMLNVVLLNVVMLNVVLLNVVALSKLEPIFFRPLQTLFFPYLWPYSQHFIFSVTYE
jgi:hypothetical protein